MNVKFMIFWGHTPVTEHELTEAFAQYTAQLVDNVYHDGAIVLQTAGQPKIEILDELGAAIQNFCFVAVANLVATGRAEVYYFNAAEDLQLVRQNGVVTLSGSCIPTATYPLLPFLTQLVACGKRYLTLLERLAAQNTDYSAVAANLRSFAADAEASISTL
jgi:hypothetical protein